MKFTHISIKLVICNILKGFRGGGAFAFLIPFEVNFSNFMNLVGDPTQYQMLQQYEAQCRTFVMEYECNQGDYSYFGSPDTYGQGNSYRPFKPYHTLTR